METCYTMDVVRDKNAGYQFSNQRTGCYLGLVPARPSNDEVRRPEEVENQTTQKEKLPLSLVIGLLESPEQNTSYLSKKENNKYLPRKSKLIVDRNTIQIDSPRKTNCELESNTFLPPFFVGSPEDSFMSHLEMRIDSYWNKKSRRSLSFLRRILKLRRTNYGEVYPIVPAVSQK